MRRIIFPFLLLISLTLCGSATGQPAPTPLPFLVDVALNRPVICSSIEKPDLACRNAVDGDLSTRWSSEFSDPQWIYVDLGAPTRIERLIPRWETAFSQAHQIQTSYDVAGWMDIYSTTPGDGGFAADRDWPRSYRPDHGCGAG